MRAANRPFPMNADNLLKIIRDETGYCEFFSTKRVRSSLPEHIQWPKPPKHNVHGFKIILHLAGERDLNSMISVQLDDRYGGMVMTRIEGVGYTITMGLHTGMAEKDFWYVGVHEAMGSFLSCFERRIETLNNDLANPIYALDEYLQKELEGLWRLKLGLS